MVNCFNSSVNDTDMAATAEEKRLLKYGFGLIPEKRGNLSKYVSCVISVISAMTALYLFFQSEKKDCLTFKTCGLIYISVILGVLLDCVCLAVGEWSQRKTRYEKSFRKMLYAGFSGINWLAVIMGILFVAGMIAACYPRTESRPLMDFAVIVSGIGIGPLVSYLLKLNELSKLQISIASEENELFVGNALAWHYYIGHLQVVLPKLQHGISKSNHWAGKLHSEKLFILVPLDCDTKIDLPHVDKQIQKEKQKIKCTEVSYEVSVYRIGDKDNSPKIMVEYASTLNTLFKMSTQKRSEAIHEIERNEQVRLFYRTLRNLLQKPVEPNSYAQDCILIAYDRKKLAESGGLVALITETLHDISQTSSQRDENQVAAQSHSELVNKLRQRRHGQQESSDVSIEMPLRSGIGSLDDSES